MAKIIKESVLGGVGKYLACWVNGIRFESPW
jgi:hypothetical protein